MAAKNTRQSLSHQATFARVMSDKLVENMLGLCRPQAPKWPHEGIEVMSPRRALASDDISEYSRTSSDCSRVDGGASGKDWRQEIMEGSNIGRN